MSAANELRVLVERVVRPVRAFMRRKQKIRDDLLTSANVIFKEEMTNCGDEFIALRQTESRLGDTNIRSLEIQRSIPLLERFFCLVMSRFAIIPGEARWRMVLRHVYYASVIVTAYLVGFLGLVGFSTIKPMTLHNVLGFVGLGAVLVLIFLLLVSVVIVLGHGMWYALYRSSGPAWLQIVLFATASTFVIPATALALCLANVFDGKDPQPALAKLLPVLPACAILGPYILVFVVNLIWRTFYGPPGRSWQRTLYVDSAWCLGVSLVSFALAFAIGGDFWSGLTNFCISLLVIGCNLIPLDLIISAPANVSLVRSAREWDALSLE